MSLTYGAGQIVSLKRENPGAGQQPEHGVNGGRGPTVRKTTLRN